MLLTISLTGLRCIRTGWGIGEPEGGIEWGDEEPEAEGELVASDRTRLVVGVVGATMTGTGIEGCLSKPLRVSCTVSGVIAKSAPSNTIDPGVSPPADTVTCRSSKGPSSGSGEVVSIITDSASADESVVSLCTITISLIDLAEVIEVKLGP
jgi:hypothetical protein